MILEKAKIYGVDGVGGSDPTLTRTDSAVGLSYSIGAKEIISDFSRCYPWSEMQEVVDDVGNVFIKIPKFYAKVTQNLNGTYKYQISGCYYDGFSTLFVDGRGEEIDYVLVGKYEASGSSSKAESKSGRPALVSLTLDKMRTACEANGEGYQQYDILIDAILKLLFMIEFATTNSQSIMKGWTSSDNTAALITGHTDTVKTPSGSANQNYSDRDSCNSDGYHACKYRGIENPWGNVFVWVDGISFSEEKIFICFDPSSYKSAKVDAPYFYMGDRAVSEGYVSRVTPFEKMPLLGYTTEVAGSNNSFFCDRCNFTKAGTVLFCGGSWYYDDRAGFWGWHGGSNESYVHSSIGGRLCFKPIWR